MRSVCSCLRKTGLARPVSASWALAPLLPSRSIQTLSIPEYLLPSAQIQYRRASQRPFSPRSSLVYQSRPFSCSQGRREVYVTNPRQDEDGNDMIVDITERAASRLQEIMTKDSNPDLALRVTVQSGGCHGFQYLMSLTSAKEAEPEDDTIFEATDGSRAKVIMDEPSLELLKGSKVDFTMELIGSQFKIVGNPAATSSCGCGTSFDIKM